MDSVFASETLCDFISSIRHSVKNIGEMNEILQETVEEFAIELGLGKLSVMVSNPPNVYEPLGINQEIISYESEKGFNPESYEKFYFTEENGCVRLKAHLLPELEWNETNKKMVGFYVDLSYLLCSRYRLLTLMDAVKITDPLTGALNLHGFQEAVGETLSKKEIQNYSVVLINFKNFKYINQKVTTDNGDIILRKYCMLVQGFLEKQGYEVTYLGVDEDGLISLEELEAAIRPDTILISVMFANNEIGTIEPIKEIGEIAKKHGVLFHTDAVQAFGHVPINVQELNIDMLSASGHKFHGPKGVGFFYLKNGIRLGPFIHGGAQERSRRAGTTNVPGVVGMAKAAELAVNNLEENSKKITAVRDHLIERVLAEVPYVRLNGHRTRRLPNNANFCFRYIEGESLLIMLDQKGICGSSGSACTSGSLDPSHVLLAIGLPHEIAHGSLRLTLSEETTIEDADYVVESVKAIVERLRSMSPLYEDFVKDLLPDYPEEPPPTHPPRSAVLEAPCRQSLTDWCSVALTHPL